MERYKTRPGVILTEIAGEYILVAAKALSGICPYVTQINESSAFLWEHMKKGASEEELIAAVMEEYDIDDPEEIREAVLSFIKQMEETGYLMNEEEII